MWGIALMDRLVYPEDLIEEITAGISAGGLATMYDPDESKIAYVFELSGGGYEISFHLGPLLPHGIVTVDRNNLLALMEAVAPFPQWVQIKRDE